MIEQIMTYVVLPVGGFVWWMHQKQVTHYTRITVLEKLFEQEIQNLKCDLKLAEEKILQLKFDHEEEVIGINQEH